ncbi:MAG: TolC family protein [Cyclobacteriaceae bacterium]|nr:TolC family protein [Cyclobacteriaceae bacterium]
MKTLLFILLMAVLPGLGFSQTSSDSVFILPDTVQAFTLENFYGALLENHPLVRQARLLPDAARQEVRFARGAFDPKLEASYNTKEYQDKEYYNKFLAAFTIPVWFPVDPKIGIEQNEGTFINPESSIPSSDDYKQLFTGIRLPVGRGLFTDERRAAVKQAQLFTEMAEAEQVKMINKILLEAAKDYWQWYFTYYAYRLLSNNTRIAEEIYRRVNLNASMGEASGIDTVQAKITLQQRLIERQEAYLDFLNQGIKISNYLWDPNQNPLQLSPSVAPVLTGDPESLSTQTLNELMFMARQNHPELQKLSIKLNQLEVERKLAVEYLKPRLDLQYSFLNQPITPDGSAQSFSLGNDYKFGVDFSIPVLLRKERAKLGQTKLKIRSTQLERTQAERDILNQIQQVYNQLTNTQLILNQQSAMVDNYERLLDAELLNLQLGESDLFKINVQQEKLIQSQMKFLKLRSEYEKLKASLYWAAGVRNLNATR